MPAAGRGRGEGWARREGAASPVVATLSLVGAAVVLAIAFYTATEVASAQSKAAPPTVAFWESGQGRLLVVQGAEGADWADFEASTDPPAQVRLGAGGPALSASSSPSVREDPVDGGDALHVCAVGGPAQVEVTLVHGPSHSVVLKRVLDAPACR